MVLEGTHSGHNGIKDHDKDNDPFLALHRTTPTEVGSLVFFFFFAFYNQNWEDELQIPSMITKKSERERGKKSLLMKGLFPKAQMNPNLGRYPGRTLAWNS